MARRGMMMMMRRMILLKMVIISMFIRVSEIIWTLHFKHFDHLRLLFRGS
jgi:hypothetical protein